MPGKQVAAYLACFVVFLSCVTAAYGAMHSDAIGGHIKLISWSAKSSIEQRSTLAAQLTIWRCSDVSSAIRFIFVGSDDSARLYDLPLTKGTAQKFLFVLQ